MKNDPLTNALQAALALTAVLSLVFCMQWGIHNRDLRALNAQLGEINNTRAKMQLVAADCIEYSKKNSAIDPLLESVGLLKATPGKQPAK
jgi:hypothetical protein